MARLFTAASSEIAAYTTGALLTAAPLTLVAWVRLAAVGTATRTIITLRDKDNASAPRQCFNLEMDNLEQVAARTGATSASSVATHASALTVETWAHAAAVFTSTTEYKAFKDGSGTAATVTARTPAGVDSVQVGGSFVSTSTVAQPWDGDIAEAAVYNVALSDADIAMLAAGYSPLMVRPDALVAYWPVVGKNSPETDIVGAYGLTLTGTSASEHPRIIRPSAKILTFPTAGGGTIGSGTGSSAGTATASATGASTAASTASSAGTATASAVGASTAAAAGSSAGVATASAVGEDAAGGIQSGAGTSAGTATASAVGASTAAAAGTSAGTSTASAVGEQVGGTQEAVGTSAGSSTAAAVGASTAAGAGSSAGVATASAVGVDASAETPESASLAGLRVHAAREMPLFFSMRSTRRRTSRASWPTLRAA